MRVYPNPFHSDEGVVTFAYRFSASQVADNVNLEVFVPSGDLVYSETRENVDPQGRFEWGATTYGGTPVASGIYIYRVSARQADILIQEIGKLSVVR